MATLPLLLPNLAGTFEPYITLHRVSLTRTYSYAARGVFDLPVNETTQHGPKCKSGESWMYVAIPEGASTESLEPDDCLYVGAQTQDRMFRGDGCSGLNYHHAEMRAGNGADNPVEYLRSGRRIQIHRAPADAIETRVEATPQLAPLRVLLHQPRTTKRHLAWWFEQYVLYREAGKWRWNTAPADKVIGQVVGRHAR